MTNGNVRVIRSNHSRFTLGLKEIWDYRELLLFFAWRQIKTRYKQTSIGIGWAVLQPIMTMVVFTIVFGHMANFSSEGYSYEVFVFPTLILWTYFSTVLTQASVSLVNNANMISKVYFPRMVLPLGFCIAGLLDFGIALGILLIIMVLEHVAFSLALLLMVPTLALTFMLAAGLGFWFSAMAAKYRDIQYVTPILVQLLLFASPVIYSWSVVTDPLYRTVLTLNPLTGIMVTQRALVLRTPLPGVTVLAAVAVTLLVLITGMLYFKAYERQFADVI